MKPIRNTRGQLQFGVTFILKIVLFMVIIGGALFVFNNVSIGDIKAQNAVRNLGVAFDVLALTTKDVSMDIPCPDSTTFTIEKSRISAKVKLSLGEGFATYHFMHTRDDTLTDKKIIDCTGGGVVAITKTYNPTTLKPAITVK